MGQFGRFLLFLGVLVGLLSGPLELVLFVPRRRRRKRVARLTAEVQQELDALDAAVATLRKHGVELRSRSAGQAQQVPRNGADPWDGPAHLVQNAMLRVNAILAELRGLRGAAGGGTES